MKKGFTLIELLVVIAIIGVLSSVVLVSLNSARSKGSDAAIKSNLNGIRAQSEVVFDTAQSYAGVCADSTVILAMKELGKIEGDADGTNSDNKGCHNGTDSWNAFAKLKTDAGKFWCVDYTGIATSLTAAPGDGACVEAVTTTTTTNP